jgi:phytoene dehydrogenase-like protein
MAHTLKQSAFFRPKNVSDKVKGLYFVGHNSIPGIGLPMCLIGAELVFKRLTGDGSAGPIKHELTALPDEAWKALA